MKKLASHAAKRLILLLRRQVEKGRIITGDLKKSILLIEDGDLFIEAIRLIVPYEHSKMRPTDTNVFMAKTIQFIDAGAIDESIIIELIDMFRDVASSGLIALLPKVPEKVAIKKVIEALDNISKSDDPGVVIEAYYEFIGVDEKLNGAIQEADIDKLLSSITNKELTQHIVKNVLSGRSEFRHVPQSSIFKKRRGYYVRTSAEKIPGKLLSAGEEKWLHRIYVSNFEIDPKMFELLDLHHRSNKIPGYLGWIGGTINREKGILYIDELQSDLMQRTFEFTDQEKYRERIDTSIDELTQKVVELDKRIQQLGAELDELEGIPDKERTHKLINTVRSEISTYQDKRRELLNKRSRTFKHSEFSQYKSRLENTYKYWFKVFINSALKKAKDEELDRVRIITAAALSRLWSSRPGLMALFEKLYDKQAEELGAKKIDRDWWEIDMSKITSIKESRRGIC